MTEGHRNSDIQQHSGHHPKYRCNEIRRQSQFLTWVFGHFRWEPGIARHVSLYFSLEVKLPSTLGDCSLHVWPFSQLKLPDTRVSSFGVFGHFVTPAGTQHLVKIFQLQELVCTRCHSSWHLGKCFVATKKLVQVPPPEYGSSPTDLWSEMSFCFWSTRNIWSSLTKNNFWILAQSLHRRVKVTAYCWDRLCQMLMRDAWTACFHSALPACIASVVVVGHFSRVQRQFGRERVGAHAGPSPVPTRRTLREGRCHRALQLHVVLMWPVAVNQLFNHQVSPTRRAGGHQSIHFDPPPTFSPQLTKGSHVQHSHVSEPIRDFRNANLWWDVVWLAIITTPHGHRYRANLRVHSDQRNTYRTKSCFTWWNIWSKSPGPPGCHLAACVTTWRWDCQDLISSREQTRMLHGVQSTDASPGADDCGRGGGRGPQFFWRTFWNETACCGWGWETSRCAWKLRSEHFRPISLQGVCVWGGGTNWFVFFANHRREGSVRPQRLTSAKRLSTKKVADVPVGQANRSVQLALPPWIPPERTVTASPADTDVGSPPVPAAQRKRVQRCAIHHSLWTSTTPTPPWRRTINTDWMWTKHLPKQDSQWTVRSTQQIFLCETGAALPAWQNSTRVAEVRTLHLSYICHDLSKNSNQHVQRPVLISSAHLDTLRWGPVYLRQLRNKRCF